MLEISVSSPCFCQKQSIAFRKDWTAMFKSTMSRMARELICNKLSNHRRPKPGICTVYYGFNNNFWRRLQPLRQFPKDYVYSSSTPPPPGWVTPLYKVYRYVTPHRAGFLPILVWNQVWFSKELRGSDAWTYLSCQFQMSIRKKEREICEFEMDLKNSFVRALI